MNGDALQQSMYLNPNQVPDKLWKIVAIADMNGDGKADLVWQHDQGWLSVWFMNGVNLISDHVAFTLEGSGHRVEDRRCRRRQQ